MGFVVHRTVKCKECGKLFEINVDAKIYSNEINLRKMNIVIWPVED